MRGWVMLHIHCYNIYFSIRCYQHFCFSICFFDLPSVGVLLSGKNISLTAHFQALPSKMKWISTPSIVTTYSITPSIVTTFRCNGHCFSSFNGSICYNITFYNNFKIFNSNGFYNINCYNIFNIFNIDMLL